MLCYVVVELYITKLPTFNMKDFHHEITNIAVLVE